MIARSVAITIDLHPGDCYSCQDVRLAVVDVEYRLMELVGCIVTVLGRPDVTGISQNELPGFRSGRAAISIELDSLYSRCPGLNQSRIRHCCRVRGIRKANRSR